MFINCQLRSQNKFLIEPSKLIQLHRLRIQKWMNQIEPEMVQDVEIKRSF